MKDLIVQVLRDSHELLAIAEGRGPAYQEAEDCARAAAGLVRLAAAQTPAESRRCIAAAATALEWGRAALPA